MKNNESTSYIINIQNSIWPNMDPYGTLHTMSLDIKRLGALDFDLGRVFRARRAEPWV